MSYEFTQQYERNNDDFYIEPYWCIESLIDNVPFRGMIHDPACGTGKIPKTFIDKGFAATGSDLRDRGYSGGLFNVDFFKDNTLRENIVSNPPYNLSEQFIHHALKHTDRRVAILARIAFLNGQGRYKTLYTKHVPEKVIILSRRPSMPPGGQNIIPVGGKTDFCWIVWNNRQKENKCELVWSL